MVSISQYQKKDGLQNKPTVDLSKLTTKGNRLAPGKYVLSEAYINPGPKTIQYTKFKQWKIFINKCFKKFASFNDTRE